MLLFMPHFRQQCNFGACSTSVCCNILGIIWEGVVKEAVVTLDIMNDICHPEGKSARYADRIAERGVIEKINQVVAWGRKRGHLIVHVRVGFRGDYLDGSVRSPMFKGAKGKGALLLEEWGGQFCDALDVQGGDVQVVKHRVSAFYGTDLDLVLRANDVKRVTLTGVGTNMAVELTAREAHDRDYEVQIVEDGTECGSDEEKAASVQVLSRLATWVTADELGAH